MNIIKIFETDVLSVLVLIGVDNKCYFQYIYMMHFQKHCNIGKKTKQKNKKKKTKEEEILEQ